MIQQKTPKAHQHSKGTPNVLSPGLRAQAQDSAAEQYRPFKDMDLLDIGMGQGPMGVVATELQT